MKAVIIALLLSSCAPKTYVSKSDPVKVKESIQYKKQKTMVSVHLLGLITAAWIYHSLKGDE